MKTKGTTYSPQGIKLAYKGKQQLMKVIEINGRIHVISTQPRSKKA